MQLSCSLRLGQQTRVAQVMSSCAVHHEWSALDLCRDYVLLSDGCKTRVQQDGELAPWTLGCLPLQRRCSACGRKLSGCRARRRRLATASLALLLCRCLHSIALDVST